MNSTSCSVRGTAGVVGGFPACVLWRAKAYVDDLNQLLGAQNCRSLCCLCVVAGQGFYRRAQSYAGCAVSRKARSCCRQLQAVCEVVGQVSARAAVPWHPTMPCNMAVPARLPPPCSCRRAPQPRAAGGGRGGITRFETSYSLQTNPSNCCAGESLNPEQQEAAEAELEELEKQMLEEQRLEMPAVPGRPLPAAPAAEQEAQEAQQATDEQLAQLPSVPSTKVEAQPAAAAAEEGREREPALVAA